MKLKMLHFSKIKWSQVLAATPSSWGRAGVGIFLLVSSICQAQISPKLGQKYPVHIVSKIDELLEKVKLNEATQGQLAQKAMQQDSLANIKLKQGVPIKEIKNDLILDAAFLKSLLTASEMEEYAFASNKDNRFLIALLNPKILKTSPEQENKIRQLNDSLSATPAKSIKESLQFQSQKLAKILNPKQYSEVVRLHYQDQFMADANADWNKILKFKTNTPGKETEQYRALVKHHFEKAFFLDKKLDRFDKTKRNLLDLKAVVFEPNLLTHAKILNGEKVANNKYVSVLEFEKELELNQTETDSLLAKHQVFEKIVIENKENQLKNSDIPKLALPDEFATIAKIIRPEQLNKWLQLKHKNEAIRKANESWKNLEKEQLTADVDKNTLFKEITIYHLKMLIAMERLKNYKNQENLFAVRDVEQKKPEVLKKLDAIIKSKEKINNAKKTLAW